MKGVIIFLLLLVAVPAMADVWVPAPGDYDGDGVEDVALYNKTTGWWVFHYSTGIPDDYYGFIVYACDHIGQPTETSEYVPVPRDYNGDGKTDLAVYQPSNGYWFFKYSVTDPLVGPTWGFDALGGADFVPVPRDYNGDGEADVAVYEPSTGNWFIHYSASSGGYGYDNLNVK